MWLIASIVFYIIVTLLLLRVYCRLTVGRCDSQRDMTGKTVLITGASAGIGKATAFDLARRNARVLLACRNLDKAERVRSEIISETGNTNVEVKHLELDSFASVRKCAEDVLRTEKRLDVLINNAANVDNDLFVTDDGCERILQVNHFSHFLLTLLLLDLLKKSQPSRIVNVSSLAYILGHLNLDDLMGINSILLHLGNQYYRSKLANVLFTTELARRLEGTGVTVNALHPGVILTDLLYHFEHPVVWAYRFFLTILGKTVEEGAQTTIYLAVHPEVEKTTGKFFWDCKEMMMLPKGRNKENARRLFELSEKIVAEYYPKRTHE